MGSKSKKRRLEARAAKAEAKQQADAPQEQHSSSPSPSPSLSPAPQRTQREQIQAKRQKTATPTPAPVQQPPKAKLPKSPTPLPSAPTATLATAAHTRAPSTLSVAVPGSILDSVGTHEAAAAVAGQLARAASIFGAEEVVVYDDSPSISNHWDGTISAGTAALARLLQYLETPPYLRSTMIPQSETTPELQAVEAICPSIHALHHLRGQDWRPYREGVVMRSEPGMGSFVDIGYERNAHVAQALPEGARVTLAVGNAPTPCFMPAFSETMLEARVVPPSEPRTQLGVFWGFRVRVARGINRVLKEGPHKAGYDLTIGISGEGVQREAAELVLPRYRHALVVFGGAKDLEAIADGDFSVAQAGKAAADLFSMYLNCCPESMGVAGVKREDEVLISMGYLHAALAKYGGAS